MPTWIKFPNEQSFPQPQGDASGTSSARFQALLAEFHCHKPRPTCGCIHSGRYLETSIRRLANGRFILARLPNEGAVHRQACDFYAASPDRSGRAGYVRGVMEDAGDGGYRVRLGISLTIGDGGARPAVKAEGAGRSGAGRQRAMTPLGLLHALWEEGRLNVWRPGFRGKRNAHRVARWLSMAADQFRVDRTELGGLFAAMPLDRLTGADHLLQMARDLERRRRRMVITGIVTSIEPEKWGRRNIRLIGGPAPAMFLFALPGQVDTLLRQHPYATRLLEAPAAPGGHVVGLFVVETKLGRWKDKPIVEASMQAGGLLETTADFLPVASDLERQVADLLVARERAFTKPLRYDAANELVLPDFVLTDTGVASGWPMEVFRRADADYSARREEKSAYYRDVYGVDRWWEWVAAGSDRTAMPDLPPRLL